MNYVVFLDYRPFSVMRQQLASGEHDSYLGKRCLAFTYTNQGNRVTVRDDQWDTTVTTNGVFIRSIRMKAGSRCGKLAIPVRTDTKHLLRGKINE